MKELTLFIPGEPMSKQRHRFSAKSGRAYTPKQTINYENLVKTIYLNKIDKLFWDNEPMEVTIVALFAIPSSYNKAKKRQCELGQFAPSSKDVDNIAKICLDGLNGVAYSDDKHIKFLSVLKEYTSDSSKTGVYIHITDYRFKESIMAVMQRKVQESGTRELSME